ncbi:hypothetical protein ACFGVS_25935 [Mucilaginibacter sp. AW1-7]|uniref:hypothetical protein n=1 Tax=Mucilaginibacter sp. AW1-7 TaxID=3349874 RepID=UPI003F73DAE8
MKLVKAPKDQEQVKRSKAYIKYEKLLADIEKKKQFKLNLQEGLRKAYAKIETELAPMDHELQLLLRDFLIRLDELATEFGVGKLNKEYLQSYMTNELQQLLNTFGHQDTVLSALFQKYAEVSMDDLENDEDLIEAAKSMATMLGVEINIKELLEKGQEEFIEAYKEKFIEHINSNPKDFTDAESAVNSPKAANKRAVDETDRIANDARSIYMRLIKKFHPDLETDEEARNHKTEIIKQVTRAYQENDFLTLLKLQITYIDDNETDAASVADDMLKRYVKLLTKQLEELNASIHETHFTSGTAIADFIDKNGKFSPQKFAASRRHIEKQVEILKSTLANSKKRPKGWFKDQLMMTKDVVMQNMMQDMFADMFDTDF